MRHGKLSVNHDELDNLSERRLQNACKGPLTSSRHAFVNDMAISPYLQVLCCPTAYGNRPIRQIWDWQLLCWDFAADPRHSLSMAGRFFVAIVFVLLAGIAPSAPVLGATGRAAYYRGGRTVSGEVSGPNGYTAAHRTSNGSSDQHEQRAFGNRADKRSRPVWSRAHNRCQHRGSTRTCYDWQWDRKSAGRSTVK